MSPKRDKPDAGFSIVEALAALAIFAMAGVGLVALQSQSLTALTQTEAFALADMVAQNELAETLAAADPPELGKTEGQIELAGRTWHWIRTIEATSDPLTRTVTIEVDRVRATGFIAVRGARQ